MICKSLKQVLKETSSNNELNSKGAFLFQNMMKSIANAEAIDEIPPPPILGTLIYENDRHMLEDYLADEHTSSDASYLDVSLEYSPSNIEILLSSITEDNMDALAEVVADWVTGI